MLCIWNVTIVEEGHQMERERKIQKLGGNFLNYDYTLKMNLMNQKLKQYNICVE